MFINKCRIQNIDFKSLILNFLKKTSQNSNSITWKLLILIKLWCSKSIFFFHVMQTRIVILFRIYQFYAFLLFFIRLWWTRSFSPLNRIFSITDDEATKICFPLVQISLTSLCSTHASLNRDRYVRCFFLFVDMLVYVKYLYVNMRERKKITFVLRYPMPF